MRHLFGYAVGTTLFYLCIPAFLVLLAWLSAPFFPYSFVPFAWLRYGLLAVLCLFGLLFALWSNIYLRTVGRGGPTDGFGKAVSPRTQRLVTTGPYRLTRNPMAFGTFLCYFALALYLNSIPVVLFLIILLPAALAYIRRWEERRLAADFGEEFAEYRKRVPMFFPSFRPRER